MAKPTTIHSTFQIECSLAASPEQVFDAFADPVKKRRWFFESTTHTLEEHELDFQVGGSERAQMKMGEGTPVAGRTMVNDTVYEDIVPAHRIVMANRMSFEGKPFSASLVTIEILPTESGSELILTNQGAYFEGADGPEMRKGGWIFLLDKLTKELAG
ncbi:MAG: SRPBCC family protein [Terracidiphilus sp.]|jgi:uncharacterized protein YndB with AHSA1/START domain